MQQHSNSKTTVLSRANQQRCAHCGLAVPQTRLEQADSAAQRFCCNGCESVFRIIHGLGLEQFYNLKQTFPSGEDDPRIAAAQSSLKNAQPSTFQHFDDESFQALYSKVTDVDKRAIRFELDGIYCAACIWLIEKLPQVCSGVIDTRVDFGSSTVAIVYDPNTVRLSDIARKLNALGYKPHPQQTRDSTKRRREDRTFLIQLGIAAVCAGNTMMIAISLYQGLFSGIEAKYSSFFQWVSLLVSIPAVFYSAQPFYRAAWGGLRARMLHIDLLISVGILVGFFASVANTINGAPHVYFDSICMLIFLLLLGRWLQKACVSHVCRPDQLLYAVVPNIARKIENGETIEMFSGSLTAGDTVVVEHGETLPADGLILDGMSAVDLSMLSGESQAIDVGPGSQVYAGSNNVGGSFTFRVRAAASDTRVGKLLQRVERESSRRAPIVQTTERIGTYFVFIVLLLAIISSCYFAITSDFQTALNRTLALLIVACPCALGLSAPLALSAAVRQAAKKKIFIRGEDTIERLARVRQIFFDKTGTLTLGQLEVHSLWLPDNNTLAPSLGELLHVIAALEHGSSHPVARALRNYAHAHQAWQSAKAPRFETIEQLPGCGVSGLDSNRVQWHLGSWNWASNKLGLDAEEFREYYQSAVNDGLSPLVLMRNDSPCLFVGLGDRIRSGAKETIAAVKKRGLSVSILSGDVSEIVQSVGAQLSIPAENLHAELLPEEKTALVLAERNHISTAMVGDGVNDAASLQAADVGIGIAGGAELCLHIADVYIADPSDSSVIVETLDGAQRTLHVIRRNLLFSLLYNVCGVGAAMLGLINPLLAAVLMPISSLTVVISSVLAKTFR